MYMIIFLQGFVFYGPLATIYRQARGLSMYDIFFIESISLILMILFEIPWGWFADRFGYKKTLVISQFIFFLSKIIFFKAYSFNMFLLERVFLSLAVSGISGCDYALIYLSVDEEEAEKVFGRYSAFSTSGFLIASLMSSIIVKYSMDSTAFLTIIPYGIATIVTLFIKEVEYKEEKPKLRESLKTAFKNKQIIILVVSTALISEVAQAISVFLNQLQYSRTGIDIKYFGILMIFIQIVRLSSAKTYSVTNRFGKNNSINVLYIVITISCCILVFTVSPVLSVLCIIFICGSMALIQPILLNMQNKVINTGDRATILSIYAMITDLVAAFINPIIGKTADISVSAAFKTCVVVCILAYGLFSIYKIRIHKNKVEKLG